MDSIKGFSFAIVNNKARAICCGCDDSYYESDKEIVEKIEQYIQNLLDEPEQAGIFKNMFEGYERSDIRYSWQKRNEEKPLGIELDITKES